MMLLKISILFLLASCQQGIKFHPDFYIGDYQNERIVNENNIEVFSYEESFNDFACMHKTKVKELAEILKRARIPKEVKANSIKYLQSVPFQ